MEQNPSDIAESVAKRGRDWADKEAAAQMLEETKRVVRAQMAVRSLQEAGSVSKSELIAEASDVYEKHVRDMVEARKVANVAKVNYETAKQWIELIRSQESTMRAEMQMR